MSQVSCSTVLEPKTQFRGKSGADDGLRTVECLRGRLLAERVASKAGKEETESLAKRLEGLEKKLKVEIRSRNKAEKRLRHALKKLESLKILDLPESSISSLSSYCSLSLGGMETMEEKRERSLKTEDSAQSSSLEQEETKGKTESQEADSNVRLVSQDESWSSVESEMSDNRNDCGFQEEFADSIRQRSISSTETQRAGEEQETEQDENKLAIVPVININNTPPKKESNNNKTEIKDNVQSVLFALRQVREQLQFSMARRSSVSSLKELYGH